MNAIDSARQECWDRYIHAYGTASIFERRALRFQRRVRAITFLGIGVPVAVGSVIASFGTSSAWLPQLLLVTGALSVVQLVMSVWALVARWDLGLAYAMESATENHRLAAQFQKLGKNPPPDLSLRFELADAAYQARSESDVKQMIGPSEKRYGLRCGLSRLQRKCEKCGVVPDPSVESSCPVCGK